MAKGVKAFPKELLEAAYFYLAALLERVHCELALEECALTLDSVARDTKTARRQSELGRLALASAYE